MFLISCNSKKDVNYNLVIQSATIVDTYSGCLNKNQSIVIIVDSIAVIIYEDNALNSTAKKKVNVSGKFMIQGLWDFAILIR